MHGIDCPRPCALASWLWSKRPRPEARSMASGAGRTRSRAEGERSRGRSGRWLRLSSAVEWLAGEVRPPSAACQTFLVERRKYRGTPSVGGCVVDQTESRNDMANGALCSLVEGRRDNQNKARLGEGRSSRSPCRRCRAARIPRR
jgi:hypothetical protein